MRLHVVESVVMENGSPIVVMLPFTGAHCGQMLPIARELAAQGLGCVCVDLPGHGRSGGTRGVFKLPSLFLTIRAVLEHYHQQHPDSSLTLLGSSWGGDLALLYALWEQQQLEEAEQTRLADTIIAQAVLTPWMRDLFKRFRHGLGLLFDRRGIGRRLAELVLGKSLALPRMFGLDELYHDESYRRAFALDPQVLRHYETRSYLEYLTYTPERSPESLRVPVHLMIGDKDRLVPLEYERKVYERMRSLHPETTLTVIPGGSHGLFEEFVPEAAEAIRLLIERSSRWA